MSWDYLGKIALVLEGTTTSVWFSRSRHNVITWHSLAVSFRTLLTFLTISYSKFNKLDLAYSHEQAISECIFWIRIKSINFGFRNPRMKNPKKGNNESWFLTSFVTKHTWHSSVDNRDVVFQNCDRNCAKFAFHCSSANKKSSNRGLNDPNKIVYGMPRQIVELRCI